MKNTSLFRGRPGIYYLIFIGWCIPAAAAPALDTVPLYAIQQQYEITGTITYDNIPMSGVTIAVVSKEKGITGKVVSGIDGKYSIAANPGDTLVFSYTGFKTVTLPINGRKTINAILEEEAQSLQEVTVNAGYYTVKESERTGSISKITSNDIEKQPVTSVLATMQGRMAGVNITQETGVAGGGFTIRIRGQNSIRSEGNEPLYVIDGVPYASEAIGFQQISGILAGTSSPLNSISPDDIESVEVLKDADATAIYGSRGANGVVLVTTKKAKQGKTRYSASASHGWGKVSGKMKLMDTQQYLAMRRQAFANDGVEIPAYAYDVNGTWDANRYTDWQKELIGGIAEISALQASVSGGSAQTQFLLSANSHTEGTVFPGSYRYRKAGFHAGITHESEDRRFKANFTAGYTAQHNDQPGTDLTRDAILLPPNAPALYNADGSLNWENGTFSNPLASSNGIFDAQTRDLTANTLLSYNLLKGLQLRSSFGYTDLSYTESRTIPSTVYNPSYGLGPAFSSLTLNTTERRSWIIEPQLNWNRDFGSNKIDVLFGATFQNQSSDRLVEAGSGFTSNSLINDMASASSIYVYGNQETVYKYQAFFGRVNLSRSQKYFLNLTGRRDGSSRFGPGNQFATFGAVGGAWLFSRESFLANNFPMLSFGKLRASYGTTGSDQIGDYQFLDTYTSSGVNYQGAGGLQPTRLYNPDFGWEVNRKIEAAMELGFLNDRIFLTAAWYRNRSSNQLVGIPLPGTTGFTSLQANLDATVENRGWELTLRTVNLKGKNWNWTSSINLTVPKNTLVAFPNLEGSTYKDSYVIGESLNIRKLYHYTGIDPQTGLYTVQDVNGDGLISFGDDAKTIVDFSPQYYGGFQNQVSYKGLTLDFLFQFTRQQNYGPAYSTPVPGTMNNQLIGVGDAWQQPGGGGNYQLYTAGFNMPALTAYGNYTASDAVAEDASYIRLKNVALSYELPLRTKGLGCKLSVQAQNLLTITSYSGLDPEFRYAGYLPPLRVVTVGTQLNF